MRDLGYCVCACLLVLLTACTTPVTDRSVASIATPVGGLFEDDAVQRALAHIERQRSTSLRELIELTQIPAPPFGEAARGERFATMLEETGFGAVHTDAVGNVIGVRPGSAARGVIAVVAHLDTVFPAGTDVTVKVDGSRYTAPGIGDNTRGLVLLLELARAIVAANLHTEADIWLVANVGEEGLGDLRGVRHLYRPGAPAIDTLIAIDGGRPGRIVTDAVGSNRFRVTFSGPGGHSWGDFGLASPHHALGTAIDLFDRRAREVTATPPRTSYNVGRIGGGTSVNSVAFESWMEVDMRSVDASRLEALTQVFQRGMQDALVQHNEARRDGPALALEVKSIGQRPAGNVDRTASVVRHAAAALRYVGIEPEFVASSTDANIPMSLGKPALTLSRGGISSRAHSLDENWEDRDTHLSTQAALLTVLAEAGYATQ